MSGTDLELLARYTQNHSEDAFAEVVRRHVDLVHSAALRQVRSPQLAEEVSQSVFVKLARNAPQLAPDTIITAWLYQVTSREAVDVVRREARRQLREQIATEMNAMNATEDDWTHIEPLLDEAVLALDETDRAAVLLRYFENKSLREVGESLGTSENAAQKRLSRSVERLREFFAKRGVKVSLGGLTVTISSNAVQAAPAGMAAAISTGAIVAGTSIATTATVGTTTATKAIVMTTLQKTVIGATLVAAVGTGIYEVHQKTQWRGQVNNLQEHQGSLAAQISGGSATKSKESNNSPTNIFRPLKLDWTTIESKDYREYIQNMRDASVPEQTIRDIILADVNALFKSKLDTLRLQIKAKKTEYWHSTKSDQAALQEKIKETLDQKSAILKNLLGIDIAFSTEDELKDVNDRLFFLDDSKKAAVAGLLALYKSKADSVRGKLDTPRLLRKLEIERDAELSKILSPEDKLIYDAFNTTLGAQIQGRTEDLGFSKSEFDQLLQARQEFMLTLDSLKFRS